MTSRKLKICSSIAAVGLSLGVAGTALADRDHHERHERYERHGWSWRPEHRHYYVERGPRYYPRGYTYYRPYYYSYPAPYTYGYYQPYTYGYSDPYDYGYYPPDNGVSLNFNW